MRSVEIIGPREARLVEGPDPTAKGDVVTVKVLVAPMCTEWQSWRAGKCGGELGHEAVGIVVDAAKSSRLKAGQRVIAMPHWGCGKCPPCRAGEHIHCTTQRDILNETGSVMGLGGYADMLIKPDYLLYPVPDDIGTDHAAMALCALGPSFTAMERMGVGPDDTVLVSGCGAVGLGAIVNAVTLGARVVALEPHPWRAALARDLGAAEVLDPRAADIVAQVRALTGGQGADAAIETSNNEAVPPVVIELVRQRGRLSFVTWTGAVPVARITGKGIDIFGAWHWNHDRHGDKMMERVRKAAPLLDRLVTHRFALADVAAAFALQESGQCGKVLLYPEGVPQ